MMSVKLKPSIHLLFLLFTLCILNGFAAKRYWVGTGANKNWNSTGNWSTVSGGTSGSSVPGSSDSVYFDTLGPGQCSINATVSIKRLEIMSNYHDTIKQNTYGITVGTSGMILSGGVFQGGASNITDQGIFTLSGMNFISTSGNLTIEGNYSFSSGTFSNNNGTVVFDKTLTISGSTTFYILSFTNAGLISTYTINSGTTLTCTETLKINGNAALVINTGDIIVQGDIDINNSHASGGGTAVITINGTSKQTITGATSSGLGKLCSVTINKSSDTLVLKNYVSINGDWDYVQGVIDASTNASTVIFYNTSASHRISGTLNLYNVWFGYLGPYTFTIPASDTLTVEATLRFAGTQNGKLDSGVVNAKGDIALAHTHASSGGSAVINICGSIDQTFTGGSLGEGNPSNIKINKTGGTLILKDIINIKENWEYVQGNIDAGTYTSTVAFTSNSTGRTISGKHSLYNVRFQTNVSTTTTIPATDTLTILGSLIIGSTQPNILNTGILNLKGNLTISNTSTSSSSGGNATILFSGTGNQTITGTTTAHQGKQCHIKINKSSGTVILKDIITLGNSSNWELVNGTLDPTIYSSTVMFPLGTHSIKGNQTFDNLTFTGNGSSSTNNINSGDTLTVNSELRIEGTNPTAINTGVILAKGDITVTNSSTSLSTSSGTIRINGTGNQIFTGSGTALAGRVPNIIVDKTSDTLTLSSIITGLGSWEYKNGIVNSGTSTFYCSNTFSLDGEGTGGTMAFYNVAFGGGTTTLTGKLTAIGTININTGATLNGNSKVIQVGGNWINTGTFTYSGTKVSFVGTINGYGNARQYIIKSSGSVDFSELTINKTSGTVYLTAPANVNTKLVMKKGHLATTPTNLLTMVNGSTFDATYKGADTSYICGPVKKIGNAAFDFPLGDSAQGSTGYHPIAISAPSNSSDAYTVRYYPSYYGDSTHVDSINISNCEYWTIARNVGSSNVLATLGWNANSNITSNAYDMVVAGWDGSGSTWKSLEGSSIYISGSRGTVAGSITPFWNGTSAVPVTIAKKKGITISDYYREPYCFTGSTKGFVHLTVTYGAPPFSYAWTDSITASSQDIDSLDAGLYSLEITDRKGRVFNRAYTLEECTKWSSLPSGVTSDTTGQLHKSTGDTTWAQAQSVLIIDSLETGRWIKFTIADTATKFLIGFGPVAADSTSDETNIRFFLEGNDITVIETDEDGFYSKQVIGTVAVNDVLKVALSETDGILYYKNDVLIHTGKLLSNARMQLTADLYGSNKNIKKIRCSSNN